VRRLAEVENHLLNLENEVRSAEVSAEFPVARIFESVRPYEREFVSLLFLIPFLQPIPLWGVSSVLGILLMLLHGSFFVRGTKAGVPKRVAAYVLSRKVLLPILVGARAIVRWVERVPAWQASSHVVDFSVRWNAGAMALLAVFLSLPLPVPASNAIPAYTILVFVLADLSENLLLLVLAWMGFLGNLFFFALIALSPYLAVRFFPF
jgi:hypothetical protein